MNVSGKPAGYNKWVWGWKNNNDRVSDSTIATKLSNGSQKIAGPSDIQKHSERKKMNARRTVIACKDVLLNIKHFPTSSHVIITPNELTMKYLPLPYYCSRSSNYVTNMSLEPNIEADQDPDF